MNAHLKSSLINHIQKWLEENADDIGGSLSIWQDADQQRNATLMATASETVLDAMSLQSELEVKLNP